MDIQKDKLTIQEVSQAAGLSTHTLRYYERIGLIHPIRREQNTLRHYTMDDVGWILFLLKLCEELDLASVNRSALARGALSGKYTKDTIFPQNDVRADPWSHDHFFAPTLDQLDSIREILTSNGRTLVQGALAWIWDRRHLSKGRKLIQF